MLPTFVIGLREGLEAALIVGIVAAFLRQRGRIDLLRRVFVGVGAAVALCVAGAVLLEVLSRDLPQKQQEGLETVIGAVAVGTVTYMVVWMRRHSRELKGQLEGAAATALAAGSGLALVAMAFLAVLREGFETVVFLLAAFNESSNGASVGFGAALGIVASVALGWGLYRGGVKLDLSKFFRATGVVLVLVAAGLVVSALHTAHEAGWLNVGQQATVDLSSVVRPGSVQASLLTGMLGIQTRPVLIEVMGWLAYLVPVGLYVAWPPGRGPARAKVVRVALGAGAVAAVAAIVLAVAMPGRPARSVGVSAGAQRAGVETHAGLRTDVYTEATTGDAAAGRPATLSYGQVAAANGGRLPLGVQAGRGQVPVTYAARTQVTYWVEPRTGRVVDTRRVETITTSAALSVGTVALGTPRQSTSQWPAARVAAAVSAVRADRHVLDRRSLIGGLAGGSLALAVLALTVGGGAIGIGRRRATSRETAPTPAPDLVPT